MKTIIIVYLTAAVLLAAGDDKKNKKDAKKTTAPAAAPTEVKIPAGAVPTEDGSFKFTDAQGKKWIYRNTPFGVAKSEDRPAPAVVKQDDKDPTVAYEEGDSIRFEKPTPFGPVKWRKKKSDLDETEKKIVERQANKQ